MLLMYRILNGTNFNRTIHSVHNDPSIEWYISIKDHSCQSSPSNPINIEVLKIQKALTQNLSGLKYLIFPIDCYVSQYRDSFLTMYLAPLYVLINTAHYHIYKSFIIASTGNCKCHWIVTFLLFTSMIKLQLSSPNHVVLICNQYIQSLDTILFSHPRNITISHMIYISHTNSMIYMDVMHIISRSSFTQLSLDTDTVVSHYYKTHKMK